MQGVVQPFENVNSHAYSHVGGILLLGFSTYVKLILSKVILCIIFRRKQTSQFSHTQRMSTWKDIVTILKKLKNRL